MKQAIWFVLGFIVAMAVAVAWIAGPFDGLRADQRNGGLIPTRENPTPAATATRANPTPRPFPSTTAAPTGAILEWSRQGGLAGFCDTLSVDNANTLRYGSCRSEIRTAPWNPDDLQTFMVYLARYAPFELQTEDNPGGPDSMRVSLRFAGRGTRQATAEERAEVARWAGDLYARLQNTGEQDTLVARTRGDLATRLGVTPESIAVRSAAAVTWPDACLGIHRDGIFCAAVLTPGYRIVLEAAGTAYEYRTDRRDLIRLVDDPRQAAAPAATAAAGEATATPAATPRPTPVVEAIVDWRGEYYDNTDLSGTPLLIRNDRSVNFDWHDAAPHALLPADGFSVRWSRNVHFDEGVYLFRLESDDGARLWVAGNLLLDRWRSGPLVSTVAQQIWTGDHEVVVEYADLGGESRVSLSWERQEKPRTPTVEPTITAWRGEYFDNATLAGAPRLVRNEEQIAFEWGDRSPADKIPSDGFSARYTRTMQVPEGLYRLFLSVDDGARIYVDDQLAIDAWQPGIRRDLTRDMLLGGKHTFRIEYFEQGGSAALAFDLRKVAERPVQPLLPSGKPMRVK